MSPRPHTSSIKSHRSDTTSDAPPLSMESPTAAAASVVIGGGLGVPGEAKHEWERGVAHPYNFVTTARQTRTDDVRPASKWAAVSFFENDPETVKRHLDIIESVEKAHYDVSHSVAPSHSVVPSHLVVPPPNALANSSFVLSYSGT